MQIYANLLIVFPRLHHKYVLTLGADWSGIIGRLLCRFCFKSCLVSDLVIPFPRMFYFLFVES